MNKRQTIKAVIKIIFTWQSAKGLIRIVFTGISALTLIMWTFLLFPTILTAIEENEEMSEKAKRYAPVVLLTAPIGLSAYLYFKVALGPFFKDKE